MPIKVQLFEHQDKLLHMLAYFIMGIIAWIAFYDARNTNFTRFFRVILFCSLYGIFDEWHQSFVPGRSSDFWDWLADTSGGLLAGLSGWYIEKLINRPTSRQ